MKIREFEKWKTQVPIIMSYERHSFLINPDLTNNKYVRSSSENEFFLENIIYVVNEVWYKSQSFYHIE